VRYKRRDYLQPEYRSLLRGAALHHIRAMAEAPGRRPEASRYSRDNEIINTVDVPNVNEALAIQAIGTSSVRIQNGNNQIDGNILATGSTNFDFRDVAMIGRADIGAHSRLRLRGSTVTGDVFLTSDSLLDTVLPPNAPPLTSTVIGDVFCSNSQSLINDANLVVTGSISTDCTLE
jgi:hypothetical protein